MSSLDEIVITSISNFIVQGFLIVCAYLLATRTVNAYQKRKDIANKRENLIGLFSQLFASFNSSIVSFNHLRTVFLNPNIKFATNERLMIRSQFSKDRSECISLFTQLFYKVELYLYPNLDNSKIQEVERCIDSWRFWTDLLDQSQKEDNKSFNTKLDKITESMSENMKVLMKIILTEKISV